MQYTVQKFNKRLWIFDPAGIRIYTPPDFLRQKIKSRQQLEEVAEELTRGRIYIDAIMDFETRLRP